MVKQKSIKLNMVLSAISSVLSIIIPIITFPYFSRILMPEGLGLYSFLNSFVNNFYVFAVLGISTYGTICCSRVRDNKNELSKAASELYLINIILSMISYSVLFIMMFFMEKLSSNFNYLIIISISSITTVLNMNWLVQANEEYVFSTLKGIILNIVTIVFLFVFVRTAEDLDKYIYINMGFLIVGNVINFFYAKRFVKFNFKYGPNLKKHLKPILLYFAIALATTIFMDMDKVLLGFMLCEMGDYYVGIYEVSSKINRVLITVISGTVGVLAPRMSYLVTNGKEEEFKLIMSKTLTYVFLLSLSALIYFSMFGEKIILAFLGDIYKDSIVPMLVLLPIVVIKSVTNITNMSLMAKSKEYHMTIALLIGSVINIIFNVVLIPKYNVLGVVIGTLISELFVMIYQIFVMRKFVFVVFKKLNYKMIAELLIIIIPSMYVCMRFININLFADFIISAMIFAVELYLIMLINKDEYIVKITNKILCIFRRKKMLKKLKMKIINKLKDLTIGTVSNDRFIRDLRDDGVTIGERVHFYCPYSIIIDTTRPYCIKIGNDVQITKDVTILTHGYDWSVVKGTTGEILGSCGEVVIGNNVFIGTKSTILKNVHIGNNVIIGAGSLVNKDCESGYVYAGVPAKKIMSVEEYAVKMRNSQFDQAYSQVKYYYIKYNKFPDKTLLNEFFFLFEDRTKPLCEVLDNKLKLLGNYELSKKMFLDGNGQKFANYEEFLEECKKQLIEEKIINN